MREIVVSKAEISSDALHRALVDAIGESFIGVNHNGRDVRLIFHNQVTDSQIVSARRIVIDHVPGTEIADRKKLLDQMLDDAQWSVLTDDKKIDLLRRVAFK